MTHTKRDVPAIERAVAAAAARAAEKETAAIRTRSRYLSEPWPGLLLRLRCSPLFRAGSSPSSALQMIAIAT